MKKDLFIEIRRKLHQIPELGFEEVQTQAFLLEYIQTLPQDYLEVTTWKTGIFVRVNGRNPSKTIAYRADIDGLPVEEQTSLEFASVNRLNMHACGHDFHMSIALGVLTHFSQNRIEDDLLFIFQPAEEGPGGAQPMLNSEPFMHNRPDQIIALHVAPEYPVGTIATREGLLFANTSELFIDFKGVGGHAAYPHTTNDMIVAASHFVTQLQTIVSRNIDPLDSAVVTIGKITGGTKQNIIAEKARVEGTIRTLSITAMDKVKRRIESLTSGIESGFECEATIDYGSNYCQVFNEANLTREFMEYSRKKVNVIECKEAMTGEDFGYFLEEVPGFMFWLGVDSRYGLHDARMNPKEEAIPIAIDLIIGYLTYKGNRQTD